MVNEILTSGLRLAEFCGGARETLEETEQTSKTISFARTTGVISDSIQKGAQPLHEVYTCIYSF